MTDEKRRKMVRAYLAASKPEEIVADLVEKFMEIQEQFSETKAKVNRHVLSPDELSDIIRPLIPPPMPGAPGRPPTKAELSAVIKPLIPAPKPGKTGKPGKAGLDGSPDAPEDIVAKLKTLTGKKRLSIYDLKDWEALRGAGADRLQWNAVGAASAGSGGTPVSGETVAGNGTSFTLAHIPINNTLKLYARGQRYTAFTASNALITTVDTWAAGDIVADYNY